MAIYDLSLGFSVLVKRNSSLLLCHLLESFVTPIYLIKKFKAIVSRGINWKKVVYHDRWWDIGKICEINGVGKDVEILLFLGTQ